jgi:hypothetical protein
MENPHKNMVNCDKFTLFKENLILKNYQKQVRDNEKDKKPKRLKTQQYPEMDNFNVKKHFKLLK